MKPDAISPIRRIAVVGFEGYLKDYTITHFRMPRIGPVIIGTLLRDMGYEVKVFAEGVKALDAQDMDYICSADLVAISVLTYGAGKCYRFCAEVHRRNPKLKIVIGDVHASIMPEHCLQYSHFAIRDEGDEPIVELVTALNEGREDLYHIKGLSWWKDGSIIHNEKRDHPGNIDILADLDLVENFYNISLSKTLARGKMTLAVAQASRGCPVACKFCLGAAILGTNYRTRGIDGVIENLNMIRRKSEDRKLHVFFIDNHFFINKRWTKELLRRIIAERYNFNFITFGQYFIGKDDEMLELLRQAHFVRIFVGFESINPNTLKEFNKRQSEETMRTCVANMHRHGVHIHGSFMMGGETDTLETTESTVRFAIETDIATASFFALCEYPFESHSFVPATNMLPKNRLLPNNLDHYNLNFVSIFPKMMRPSDLQRKLIWAHEEFFSLKRVGKSVLQRDFKRMGMRAVGHWAQRKMVEQMRAYIPYLEEREKGLYTPDGQLIESKLPAFHGKLITHDQPAPLFLPAQEINGIAVA